jgi:hypothetical protein
MPVQLRPDKKLAKMLYKIMGTPKTLQQKEDKNPTEKQLIAWRASSSTAR